MKDLPIGAYHRSRTMKSEGSTKILAIAFNFYSSKMLSKFSTIAIVAKA
jgi:hypothetical protein